MEAPTTLPKTTLRASDVMTREVISVPADIPVYKLAEFLIEHQISGAPVVTDESELIGVVSMTDIARHDGLHITNSRKGRAGMFDLSDKLDEEELSGFRLGEESGATARDIMTPAVFGVVESMPVQDVADYMIRGRIHRQFVTRGKTVVGVITAMDLLRVVRDLPR